MYYRPTLFLAIVFASACSGDTSSSSSSSSSGSSSGATSASSSGGLPDASVDPGGKTAITGTLGALGAVQPTVSSLFISNSGETLVYLSSAPIACGDLTTSRWLGKVQAGTQVVEIVLRGAPKADSPYPVPPSEVNYAAGGKSSASEVVAAAGSISFTKADASLVQGKVQASYPDGSTISGTFNATFCPGGQGY